MWKHRLRKRKLLHSGISYRNLSCHGSAPDGETSSVVRLSSLRPFTGRSFLLGGLADPENLASVCILSV